MMNRKCENWLMSFRDWSLPRSEAPESFHLWAGLFTLSSVLKRRVYISKKLLGGWECYPTLYIIFVAPPGKARKSTTARYSEDLLQATQLINLAPTAITVEKLIKELERVKDSSISIFSSEFSTFIQKSGLAMYDVLTDLFDGKTHISVGTMARNIDFAEKPCINLLAATTPGWIAENMPEGVIGGGFASRVIFVFEERVRRYQLYYENIEHEKLEDIRKDLMFDLIHIAANIEGEFSLHEDAKSFMEQWYRQTQKKDTSTANYRLQGYFERKPAHVHKIAMLLHAAYSDELVLYQQDFEAAIKLLDQLEVKLPRTFQNIGKNPYSLDMDRISDFIAEEGRVSRNKLFSTFYNVAEPQKLNELVSALIAMGRVKIETVNSDGEPIYKFIDSKLQRT